MKNNPKPIQPHPAIQRLREALAIFNLFIAAYLALALLTYHQIDPGWSTTGRSTHIANAGGRMGAWLADVSLYSLGYFAFLLPVAFAILARFFYRQKSKTAPDYQVVILRIFGFTLLIVGGAGLASILFMPWPGMPFTSGGIMGEIFDCQLESMLNPIGAALLLWSLLLMGISLFTGVSWIKIMDRVGASLLKLNKVRQINLSFYQKLRPQPNNQLEQNQPPPIKKIISQAPPRITPTLRNSKQLEVEVANEAQQPNLLRAQGIKQQIDTFDMPNLLTNTTPTTTKQISTEEPISSLPPLRLLDPPPPPAEKRYSHTTLETMSREVELRLMDFGVQAQVVAVYPGPVVTRFELQLAPGVKVSKISNLAKDLARSLSVVSVRIVEVIPGKSVIGLEAPNEQREAVCLSEIFASTTYKQSHSPLSLALGKDISGHPVIVDLAKMPHLLVAGTTGSGKSVGLNVMLLSMLYKAPPEEVRMIMIDPKMLELSIYDGIPHLLAPVVTDMKEAANALRWCVAEMERRYRLMAALGVRNLAGYNSKIMGGLKANNPILNPLPIAPDQTPEPLKTLPYIVVLIDEFADMMMVVGKKVEDLIARIAQKARAAGIHLILATQRPSVDVITGLIKANIPTRIAFQVSSRIDSRTILDQQGAEQLLGYGDMLYLAPGAGIPMRVHGAYVSDNEVHAVAHYLKQQGSPEYLIEILETSEDSGSEGQNAAQMTSGEQDPFYDQAVQIVVKTRRASVSNIQRRLKIGYNRAARIVEDMEVAGIVSAMGANGNREVLVEDLEGAFE
jgi:S-DNA-T family DNA segregation ATPase FtsK/SpoIIIE